IFRNVKYQGEKGEGESDIILKFGGTLLFVECTTKLIQPDSRKGDLAAVEYDLAHSITKCYEQAMRAKEAYQAGRLAIPTIELPATMIPVVVTDVLYPNLLVEISTEPFAQTPTHGRFLRGLVGRR